jgi:hypothetical protein
MTCEVVSSSALGFWFLCLLLAEAELGVLQRHRLQRRGDVRNAAWQRMVFRCPSLFATNRSVCSGAALLAANSSSSFWIRGGTGCSCHIPPSKRAAIPLFIVATITSPGALDSAAFTLPAEWTGGRTIISFRLNCPAL